MQRTLVTRVDGMLSSTKGRCRKAESNQFNTYTNSFKAPMNYRSIIRFLFAGLVAGLCISQGQAQRLGGVPDPTFNPSDSGLAMPALNQKNQFFYPGPKGGLFVTLRNSLEKAGRISNRHYFETIYYTHDLQKSTYAQGLQITPQVGRFLEASPGRYYIASSQNFNYRSFDSVWISRMLPAPNATVKKGRGFYVQRTNSVGSNVGISETATNRMVFWATNHATDTLRPDNQTRLYLLDSLGTYQGTPLVLTGFRAERAVAYQGNLYLLGRQMVNDVATATQIRVVNGTTLASMTSPFTSLGNLLQGPAQAFSILAGGKVLVAGRLDRGGTIADQAVRLMPDGSIEAGYAVTTVTATTGLVWNLDAAGTLRCAAVQADANGLNSQAIVGVAGANGGITPTTVALDALWPWCQPLMYNPAQDAFLFETGDLFPNRAPVLNGGSYPNDTAYGLRHRFYVSAGGQTWPLINHGGTSLQPGRITYGTFGISPGATMFTANPVSKKIALTGQTTQTNYKLLPGFAVLNADGTADLDFQGSLLWPKKYRDKYLNWFDYNAAMTNSGKVLIHQARPHPLQNQMTPFPKYLDSTVRLLPNGAIDASYTPVFKQGEILRRKDGRLVALRLYTMQNASVSLDYPEPSKTKLVEMDAEGNFLREFGLYTTGGYPDTMENAMRYRSLYGEDNQKGIWMVNYHYAGSSERMFLVRYDSTGRSKPIFSKEYTVRHIYSKPSGFIHVLPGKRYRITGLFMLTDTARARDPYVHVIQIDSTGKLDPSFTPIKLLPPDQYGNRADRTVQPYAVQPDGRILGGIINVAGGTSHMARFYADGRFDPTFLPIATYFGEIFNFAVIDDRMYLGGGNGTYNVPMAPGRYQYSYGSSPKNGLAAYNLSVRPVNTGYVLGKVEQVTSPATGCAPAGTRRAGRSMLLKSMPGSRYAFSDTGGNYTMVVDTGSFSVSQAIENNFLQRQVCPAANAPRTGLLGGNGASAIDQNFINQTFDCPRLDLKILSPRFRLCSKSLIHLQYKNDGMAAEPAARIRLNLPQEVRILSASRPFSQDADSAYVFDLGRLEPGQQGELVIQDTIGCPATPDSMARACYSARIEPLSLCSSINPATLNWDGAWLDAQARYAPLLDQVRIVIRNRGASMADSTTALITSNGYAYLRGKIKLAAGDSLVYMVPPAIQGIIQLRIAQTPNCPLGTTSFLGHSGRGMARAFLNFGSGLLETYTVQDCPGYRFSFDPNEKAVSPAGEVEPGTELHYTIYFENYGNDTAYAVSVEDSLPAGLDVNTMKLGASSHPCQVVVEGTEAQPVLYFTFNPIKLTAKRRDSVRSKGQVEFAIRTKPGVTRGSVVQNRAHIYFDRNPAVVTEYTRTPIAREAVTEVRSSQGSRGSLSIYPNPASGSSRIVARGTGGGKALAVRLLSPDGRLLMQQPLLPDGTLKLHGLSQGIYTVLVDGYRPERLVIIK